MAGFRRSAVCIFFMLVMTGAAFGQASKTHMFPQFVDGRLGDGSLYRSILFVTNRNTVATTCTISMSGDLTASRLTTGAVLNIPPNSWVGSISHGTENLAVGYASVTCSQPVTASVIYSMIGTDGGTMSWATVFSAPPASNALLPMLIVPGLRYGIALSNDSDTPSSLKISVLTASGPVEKTVQVPARGQFVKFVDEILTLPAGSTAGTLEVSSPSGHHFGITGLLFDGNLFTTLVPIVEP